MSTGTVEAEFPPGPRYALTDRPCSDVLFVGPDGAITASMFLSAACHLADALPDASHVVNLCQDRYRFAVAFAACVLRKQVCLLTSDRSPVRLRQLDDDFSDVISVSEDPSVAGLPHHHLMTACPDQAGASAAVSVIAADQLAAIVFTSGTTGEPMANRKLWGALVERSLAAAVRFELAAEHRNTVVGTVPPQHMYGFETTILLPLHANVASWHGPAFYPHDIGRALRQADAPRILVTTPLQLRNLLAGGTELPPSLTIISATAPLPVAVAAAAEARWGAPVMEIFGATEIGSVASRRTVTDVAWTLYPGIGFHPEYQAGVERIMVTARFAESWPLNDNIEMESDKKFRLLGRTADMIKLAGKRASLSGLNQILNDIEGVTDGLFVAPDDLDERSAARLLAYVVAPGQTSENILAALRLRIDPVFLPRRVIRVDDLPRNEVGKLPRAALGRLQDACSDA